MDLSIDFDSFHPFNREWTDRRYCGCFERTAVCPDRNAVRQTSMDWCFTVGSLGGCLRGLSIIIDYFPITNRTERDKPMLAPQNRSEDRPDFDEIHMRLKGFIDANTGQNHLCWSICRTGTRLTNDVLAIDNRSGKCRSRPINSPTDSRC